MSEQNWPTLPPAETKGREAVQSDATELDLAIVIEQYVLGRSEYRWHASELQRFRGTRAEGRDIALGVARTFQPRLPMNVAERAIYRLTPDVLVVLTQGMWSSFHFRVVLVEVVE